MREPNSVASAAEAACAAAEAIRILNHVTSAGDEFSGLRYPSDVYSVVGELTHLTRRLPQTLRQLNEYIAREARVDRIAVTEAEYVGDPNRAADALAEYIARATTPAARLTDALDSAHQVLAWMAWTGTAEPRVARNTSGATRRFGRHGNSMAERVDRGDARAWRAW